MMGESMATQTNISRRNFLNTALAATLPSAIPGVWSADRQVSASNRITLGFVGTGSHGTGVNLRSFLHHSDAQVVALCDVDAKRLNSAHQIVLKHYGQKARGGTFKGCFTTGDWREIVARDDVDAVVVSTPDHWHVLPSLAAVRSGKDVICEKPLTLTVHEGRVLSDAVRRYGRVFQTSTENRSKHNFLRACELVRNGRIGKLHTIRTELPRGRGVRGNNKGHQPQPVPKHFDYDMWLGPAPEAPYTPARCHFNFRWIFDYSGGFLTDWGAHINDIAQWGNNTEHTGPVSVEGHGVFPEKGLYNTAIDWELTFEYANGVTLICKGGTPSIRFEGADGWVSVPSWGGAVQASSPDILNSVIGPEEIHLRTCSGREHRDFLNCVKSREETYAPAETGHRTISISHIGNIAMLLGRKLRWNPDAEKFINDDQANSMLSRAMRQPWSL
jgi:predicted dehydrogenase